MKRTYGNKKRWSKFYVERVRGKIPDISYYSFHKFVGIFPLWPFQCRAEKRVSSYINQDLIVTHLIPSICHYKLVAIGSSIRANCEL